MANNIFKEATFNFIGHINFGKEPLSIKNARKDGTGNLYRKKLGIGIKHSTYCPFLSMEVLQDGMNPENFKVFSLDNKLVEVPYGMTTNPEVMAKIADFTKITIDLETDFEKKKEYTSLIFKRMNHIMKKDEEKTDEDLSKIEEYTKQIKEIATNRKEFCTMNDVIDFIEKAFPIMKDKQVKVTGSVKNNYYNA